MTTTDFVPTGQPEAVTRQQAVADKLAMVREQMAAGRDLGRKLIESDRAAFETKFTCLDWAYGFLSDWGSHKNHEKKYELKVEAQQFFAELPHHPVKWTKHTNHVAEVIVLQTQHEA
jgi:hypothetical protein